MQRHDGYELGGKTVEPAESMPSSSQWGKKGLPFARKKKRNASSNNFSASVHACDAAKSRIFAWSRPLRRKICPMTNRENSPFWARSCPTLVCLTSCAILFPRRTLRCPAWSDIRCDGVDPCRRRCRLSSDGSFVAERSQAARTSRWTNGDRPDRDGHSSARPCGRACTPDRNEGQAPCVHSGRGTRQWNAAATLKTKRNGSTKTTRGLRKHADALRPSECNITSQVDGRVLPKAQSIGQRARRRGGVFDRAARTRSAHGRMARRHITLVSGETSAGKSAFAIGQSQDRCKLASNRGGRT